MVSDPRLKRARKLFERHWPWLVLTAFLSSGLCALLGALGFGLFAELSDALPQTLRGYTLVGTLLGVASVGLILFECFYALRKRGLQEQLPIFRGTMASWLWAHVYLGLFALLAACGHAGFGSVSWQFSTGKLLLVSLSLLVVSGLAWRLVYAFVPGIAAKRVGNYSQDASVELASRLLVEIEKQVAGGSPGLHALKQRLLERSLARPEFERLLGTLPNAEWQLARELLELSEKQRAALLRKQEQARFTRLLQGWRVLHVPLVLVVFALLPLHVLLAYDVPARIVEPGVVPGTALGGFETADACEPCHAKIVEQWRSSMHAHAMTSPVMIAQTNQVAAVSLKGAHYPDPQRVCVNCHGPLGAALGSGATLPLDEGRFADDALLNEGISCSVCHQWQGASHTGGAGLSEFSRGLEPGHEYFGPIGDAVGNAFHHSQKSDLFDTPEQLCRNCHAVQLDRNGDGKFEKGTDLVLQTLFDEWSEYAKNGGATCVSCHMPGVREKRAAEAANVPFEQDREAPERVVHDHSFVGVDQPLDVPPERDPQKQARAALLKSAATLEFAETPLSVSAGQIGFGVKLTNSGVGHYLPGGFAFVRQMWLEVRVENAAAELVASSGVLAKNTDDLCDGNILDDASNPLRGLLQGCAGSDPVLVNLQQQLVDVVEVAKDELGRPRVDEQNQFKLAKAAGAKEAVLQYLTGGPIPRVRPFDKQAMPPLAPGETRTFNYRMSLGAARANGGKLKVRLMFRASPPYFIRALGRGQTNPTEPRLLSLIGNLSVHEMAAIERGLP